MDPAAENRQDLRRYARILWRRKWIFLLIVVLVPVATYLVSSSIGKSYQASYVLEVEPTAIDNPQAPPTGPSPQYVAIAARLIQTTAVSKRVASQLGLPQTESEAQKLLDQVKVFTDPNTGFITITASAPDANQAANVANAFGYAINTEREQQAVHQLDQQIANDLAQFAALPRDAVIARNQSLTQITRLRAQRAAQGTNTQPIEPATAPTGPVSPQPLRDTLLSLVVAILLGLGGVALRESLDRRVRRPEEIEEFTRLPLLGTLPRSAFSGDLTSLPVSETFRTLRANLLFFNIDRDIRSVVVTSARQGEGKSLVSLGLARAAAAAGNEVILVDADLRRPTIANRLGMPAETGLATVLVGQSELSQALMRQITDGSPTRLRVLPSGKPPPNPAELLASKRMESLVEELCAMCDLLIIDTSPLLAVSDALPLLEAASGTLLVARLATVERGDLQRVRTILDVARSASLGVFATGSTRAAPYTYQYTSDLAVSAASPATLNGRNGSRRSRPFALLGRGR